MGARHHERLERVSRTTFFMWLVLRVFIAVRDRRWAQAFDWRAVPHSFALFFVAVTFSLLPDFHGAGDYRYFFFAAMHFLMIVDLSASERRQRVLLLILALTPVILVIRGIVHEPLLLDISQMRRFGYPSDHPNIVGYLLAMTIPIGLALSASEKGWLRAAALVSCAAQLLALALTYSRGAWLGWAAAMIFLLATLKRRREVAAILIAAALVAMVVTPLQSRFSTLLSPRSDLSISDRVMVIESSLKLALAHPLLGVGYGRDRLREGLKENQLEMRRIAHTHNIYVELVATTGIFGLGAFLWLIVGAFYRAWRQASSGAIENRQVQLGIAAAWIAFAVTGLGDAPFYHHETRIFFFTLLGLTYPQKPAPSPSAS